VRVYLEYLGDSVELPLGETIIGRDVGCTLRFNDPSVSRRHLKFVRRASDVFVEDLGSANGTLVNGRKLAGALRLLNNDRLVIGTRELAIRVPEIEDKEPPTLNLSDLSVTDALRARTTTTKVPVTVPPPLANQRCPRCGAAVSAEDDECASCQYRWGSFRPQSTTLVNPNPLGLRRHERLELELRIMYVSPDLEIEATTRNLSASGVFVCTQVLEPLGTRCELTLLVDGGPPLVVRGVVRRVVEHHDADSDDEVGLGIEFANLGTAERAWLDALLARGR
jgi:FHA domain/PilZ domain